MAVSATDVQKAYLAYFGRPADPVGLAYWMGQDAVTMKAGFAASVEYATLYAGMTSTQMVAQVYTNLLGREADVTGLLYWSGEMAAGRQTVSTLVDSMQANVLSIDIATIANRVTYATAFTAALDTTAEIVGYSGTAAATAARAAVSAVVDTTASLTAAQTALATSIATVVSTGTAATGSTFTLTTALDNIAGGTGNDTITGVVDGTTAGNITIGAADTINGGGGTDVLNLVYQGGTVAGIPAAAISNVETINIRAVGTGAVTAVDLSLIPGVTAVNSDRSTQAVTVTNLATGGSAGMIGNGTVVTGAFNAGYVAAATAATLNLADGVNGGAVTLSGTGLTSTTVNSTGAANTIGALALAATTTSATINATTNLTTGAVSNTTAPVLTTLTVTGAGAVNLSATALEATVTKIDASANTGGLTVAMGSAVTQTVTGGTGNDVITTGAITLSTGSVNAGAGTDTLNIGTNVGSANTASLAAKYTNFETLRVNGTFDASLVAGITAVELSGATNAITKMSATQAAAVSALADIGATTLALTTATGTSDVLSLTMGNGKGAAFDTGALTVTGFETLNVKANNLSTDADKTTVIGSFVAADLTAINLTGSSVTLTNAATTKAVTIDASALTGILTISGNVVTDSTVTGSAGKDVVTLGTGFATYNTGAGNDAISGTVAQINTGANYNTLNGGDGTDTLNITDGAGAATVVIVDNSLSKISGIEKIVITDTTTGNQTITTGGWFDAAFKASGVDLTTTTTTGTVTIDMTTFSGAATIAATTVGTAAAEGRVSIQTGSGNDTVTVTSATATTTNVISTFAGNDTIVGSLADETITGGTGADTMTGGGDADVFVIGAGHSLAASMDIITDWNTAVADTFTFAVAQVVLAADSTALVAGSNVQTSAGGLVTFHANDSTYALKLAAIQADAELDVAQSIAVFQDGLNTYVYSAGAATGNADDQIIQLTGITGTAADTITGTGTVTITIA